MPGLLDCSSSGPQRGSCLAPPIAELVGFRLSSVEPRPAWW